MPIWLQIYQAVLDVDLDRYDLREVKAIAPSLMQSIFEMRMSLRNQIGEWHRQGFMTRPVQKALRDVFRVSRYGVDMLGELGMDSSRASTAAARSREAIARRMSIRRSTMVTTSRINPAT